MKKIMRLGVCGLAAVMLIAGCSKKTSTETTSAAEETTAAVNNGTITLGEYKGMEVTKQNVEVTDEEVQARIDSDLASNPDYDEITDRAAQDGDIVNIDYVGTKDGTAFDGGTATGYDLTLGSNSFIEGFETGLIGAKTGDKVSLNLTFPAEYQNAELAGAAVVFEVTVNSIKVEKAAVLDDAFAEKVSNAKYKTVDEYRQGTKDQMLASKKSEADSQKMYEAIMAVVANSEITCDETAVEEQYNQQISYYTSMVEGYGMKLEDYVSMFGMDLETFQGQIRESAQDNIKQQLVINAVYEKEGMKVEDADREKIATELGTDVATLVTQYGQDAVDQDAKRYKVLNYLIENAVEVEATTAAETSAEETTAAETTAAETSAEETTAAK